MPGQAFALLPPHPYQARGQEPSGLQKHMRDTALRCSRHSYSLDRDKPRQGECAALKQVAWIDLRMSCFGRTVRSLVLPFACLPIVLDAGQLVSDVFSPLEDTVALFLDVSINALILGG